MNLILSNKKGEPENKKTTNDELKKKKIQKINKIIERSNAFVNELISKKNSDYKFKKHSFESNHNLYETLKKSNYKEEKLGSPLKRMKLVTKKK